MKICPVCKVKYSDTALKYCLEDGTQLRDDYAADDNPTAIMPEGRITTPPSPFDQNRQTPPPIFQNTPNFSNANSGVNAPVKKPKTWLWVLLILGALAVVCGGGGLFAAIKFLPHSEIALTENKNVKTESTPKETPASTPKTESTVKPSKKPEFFSTVLTLANYNKLDKGISYEEAVKIIGEEGEQVSSSESGSYKTETYKWTGENYSFLIATFQNGKLLFKSQSRLK